MNLEQKISRFQFSPQVAAKIRGRKRAFILGTGPSLAKVDLGALSSELVVGVNFVMRLGIRPDIICVSDSRRFDTEHYVGSGVKIITVRELIERLAGGLGGIDCWYGVSHAEYSTLKVTALNINAFDRDFRTVHHGGGVIADLAIPLLTHLGIEEIFVLGMDGLEASFPASYFWGQEHTIPHAPATQTFHLHEKVAHLAKQEGTEVFNATPGGVVTAFEKVSLTSIMPKAWRTGPVRDIQGRFIAFRDRVLRIEKSPSHKGAYRFREKDGLMLRHREGALQSDVDDRSALFAADSSFKAEPSFVNPDWICLRAMNTENGYVTTTSEHDGFRLRPPEEIFSAYFSSFPTYSSSDVAEQRAEQHRQLLMLANMRRSIGNQMISMDRSVQG